MKHYIAYMDSKCPKINQKLSKIKAFLYFQLMIKVLDVFLHRPNRPNYPKVAAGWYCANKISISSRSFISLLMSEDTSVPAFLADKNYYEELFLTFVKEKN